MIQLKDKCRQLNLPVSGTKSKLIGFLRHPAKHRKPLSTRSYKQELSMDSSNDMLDTGSLSCDSPGLRTLAEACESPEAAITVCDSPQYFPSPDLAEDDLLMVEDDVLRNKKAADGRTYSWCPEDDFLQSPSMPPMAISLQVPLSVGGSTVECLHYVKLPPGPCTDRTHDLPLLSPLCTSGPLSHREVTTTILVGQGCMRGVRATRS